MMYTILVPNENSLKNALPRTHGCRLIRFEPIVWIKFFSKKYALRFILTVFVVIFFRYSFYGCDILLQRRPTR